MNIQVYRWEGRWKTYCDVNCYTYACFRKSKSYVDTHCFTVNTSHNPFAVGKTMETFRWDMTTCQKLHMEVSTWVKLVQRCVFLVKTCTSSRLAV